MIKFSNIYKLIGNNLSRIPYWLYVSGQFLYLGTNLSLQCLSGAVGSTLGFSLAMRLGVPFVLIRKKGKLPAETISYKYDLEYGSAEIEMHIDSIDEGMHVLIHDDLLATGGTAAAAAELIKKSGGQVSGFSFVVELEFLKGKEGLNKYSEFNKSIVNY